MCRLSLQMLWKERKKAVGLIVTIATALCVTIVLLQFFNNPYVNYLKSDSFKITSYEEVLLFFDGLYKGTMILLILIIIISLMMNACDYYNKTNSRVVGLLRISGYSVLEVWVYQMIQLFFIIIVSYLLAIIASLLIIPVSQFFAYNYMSVEANIFKYDLSAYTTSFFIMILILIFIMLMEVSYFIRSSITKLLKNKETKTIKRSKNPTRLSLFLYACLFIVGIVAMYTSELNQGIIFPVSFFIIGAQGLCKTSIPSLLENRIKSNKTDALKTLVYSNYIIYIQKLKTIIILIFLSIGILTILICTNLNSAQYVVLFQLGYIMINIILSFTLLNRFKINQLNKSEYYKNLKRLGLDQEQLLATSRQEIMWTYNTIIILVLIYLVNLSIAFITRAKTAPMFMIILILEFVVPIVFAYGATLYQERENVKNGYNN